MFLIRDNWNDYSFYTLYHVLYKDENGETHDLTYVKIGYYGQEEGGHSLEVGERYEQLPQQYFSLGSEDYYENLNLLGEETRERILYVLRDIARYPDIYLQASKERVTTTSLMRGISETEVNGQLRRMANGGSRLIGYNFQYESPLLPGINSSYSLEFNVTPESLPPTNVNALIGRNAVGKTSLFSSIVKSFISGSESAVKGVFTSEELLDNGHVFANLIMISYSAFDDAGLLSEEELDNMSIPYTYIGLKKIVAASPVLKDSTELNREFVSSLSNCRKSLKQNRWVDAIKSLESDPHFRDENFSILTEIEKDDQFEEVSSACFQKLSSGHKIVLLAVTRLVETLEEKSLVLVDEPETHLHPPLLSSFITAMSTLMGETNGVAIVATHSPVVLQGVPRACVWKLRRNGTHSIAERLEIESFGENVGILTSQVFGFEVTNSGFHRKLQELAADEPSYEEALARLNGQLGLEGKAILKSLFYQKSKSDEGNR